MVTSVRCYNYGCDQHYDPAKNGPTDCRHHPGIFTIQDGIKRWHCCNRKSRDFTVWLHTPGCIRSPHSNVKKENQISAPRIRPEKQENLVAWRDINQPAPRLPEDQLIDINLKIDFTEAAEARNNQYFKECKEKQAELEIGAVCMNKGCMDTYKGPDVKQGPCFYHPGQETFHEGLKFFSCCNNKTTDFDTFMSQKGCSQGVHNWKEKEVYSKWRTDWYIRDGFVYINIYCKGVLPEDTFATTTGLDLWLSINYGFGTLRNEVTYNLFGTIVPSESKLVVGERKIEVILKQKDASAWPRLTFEP